MGPDSPLGRGTIVPGHSHARHDSVHDVLGAAEEEGRREAEEGAREVAERWREE